MIIANRYALVTGAGRGIGKAIAKELSQNGFNVIINYAHNHTAALDTLNEITVAGGTAELLQFDVSNDEETTSALNTWMQLHPDCYIAVIVNNAGVRHDNLMLWMSRNEWRKVLDTTLDGFFNVTQPLLKPMILKKWGRVINIVSLSGLKGMPGQVNYSAAKGGLVSATKALAMEVAKKRITVNAIAPGFIKSDMTADLDEERLIRTVPAGRFGTPEEVAHLVAFLASDAAAYITGEVISINGGIY